MTLNPKALAWTTALLWGASLLFVGLVNLFIPQYGTVFLDVAAAMYPGYDDPTGIGSVIVVTLYGLLHGAVGGYLFAVFYNRLAGKVVAPPTA